MQSVIGLEELVAGLEDTLDAEIGVLAAVPNGGSRTSDQKEYLEEIRDRGYPAPVAIRNRSSMSKDAGSSTIVPRLPQASRNNSSIPWVYTRENVKQDRDMVRFYLRKLVLDSESEFVNRVSEELGTGVSKTDVRETAYIASMRRPEIVADELERWGFKSK